MSEPPRRRTGGFSIKPKDPYYAGRRVDSFQRHAQIPVQRETIRKGNFPVYDLEWPKLKAFLEEKYKGFKFDKDRNVQNDKYVWIIPTGHEGLTSDDEAEIRELREAHEPPSQGAASTSLSAQGSGSQGTQATQGSSGDPSQQRPRALSEELP